MTLTNAGLAGYGDWRWRGGSPYFRLIEVGRAIVIEQYIILTYPHPRDIPFNIKVEGKTGR